MNYRWVSLVWISNGLVGGVLSYVRKCLILYVNCVVGGVLKCMCCWLIGLEIICIGLFVFECQLLIVICDSFEQLVGNSVVCYLNSCVLVIGVVEWVVVLSIMLMMFLMC